MKGNLMKKFILATTLIASLSVPAFASHPGGTALVKVNGLVCDFCARALEKVFGKEAAVENINVNLDDKIVTIHFNPDQSLDDETITKLITDSGYNVEEIKHAE
jgi:copper chaperone CopZ